MYHDGLLDQSVAVFTHVLQDLVSSVVSGCGGGFGGHSQWVDQSLEEGETLITDRTMNWNVKCALDLVFQKNIPCSVCSLTWG